MAASTERKKDPYEMGFLLAPRVPQGLAAVVESLTREVLRQRPEDIYVFAARHFEKLLTLREQYDEVNIGVDKKLNKEYNNFSSNIKKRNDSKLPRKNKRTTKDNIEGNGTRKVKKKEEEEEEEGCCWSLNETARVLERHRNIFGEGDKRISTDEIRALAKGKNLRRTSSTDTKMNKRGKMKSSEDDREYAKDTIKILNNDNDSFMRLDRNIKTIKMISQIPTVLTRNTGKKDIKMELRKNRLRDKSTDSSNNEGQCQEQISDTSRKNSSSRKTERSNVSIDKLEDELIRNKQTRRSESVERYSSRSSRSEKRKNSLTEFLSEKKELSEARNMDQVKEYVVRNFGSIQSIDQIDTSYVNKVQNVIDRNVPIIKDKIDELRYDVITKKSKGTNFNKDMLKKREIRPNTSESDNNRSNNERDKHRSKRSSSVDDSMNLKRQQEDTLESRLINTQNILEDISTKCYNKSSNLNYRIKSNNGHCVDEQQQQDNKCPTLDGNSKIILPAVRPASSKNSKCLSRGDSNNLILPPISPDTGKISKKKDDVTLPTLSTTVDNSNASISSSSLRSEEKDNNYSVDNKNDNDDSNLGDDIVQLSTSIKEDITSTRKMLENVNEKLQTPVTIDDNEMIEEMSSTRNTMENNEINDLVDKINDNFNDLLGEQVIKVDVHAEEIFQDSLNVTPDIIDIPPSPDSLEALVENRDLSTVNEETEFHEKFSEIEEINSNVENENIVDKCKEMNSPEAVIVEVSDDSISIGNEEPVKEEIVEIIKLTSDTNPKSESDDRSTGQMGNDRSEINESKGEINNTKEIDETVDNEEIINEQNNSLLSFKEKKPNDYTLNVSLSKEVPFSYILTEGSPVEIPDFVTTVIIPERSPSTPELNLDINEEEEEEEKEEEKDGEIREERRRRAVESFGEYIRPEQTECSTVDIDFIRGIKAGHEIAIIRQDLDGIKEEEEYDEEKQLKSTDDNEDEKNDDDIKKDNNSPLLEHISETEENETDDNDKCENKMIPVLEIEIETNNKIKEEPNGNVNLIENSLENEESTETVDVTSESTNEVKETTITDRSTDSLSLDPARPIVPELNLDSLRDITVSSFKMNDADETVSLTEPTLSGKDKVDLDDNILSKDDEHLDDDNDRKDDDDDDDDNDDTSPIGMISVDEKLMETDKSSSIHLDNEESNKDDVRSILSEEKVMIKNEDELSDVSNLKIQSALTETIEQCGDLKIEENTTDLDTEEEIAKELIEIDRAENLSTSENIPIVSNDSHRRSLEDDKSNEILTIVEEENIKCTNEKGDDNDSIPKNTISDTSIENLIEIVSSKNEDENISERIESTRSNNDNEKVNDRSDGNLEENNVRSDTSLTTFQEVEPKEIDTKLIDETNNLKIIESQEKEEEKEEEEEEDSSKSSSTTFHSAVTKIQAGIRGFLTRKKLQENYPRGSTLDSIPSIQETVAEEPLVDDLQSVSEKVADSLIKSALSSAMTSENMTKVEEKEKIELTERITMPIKHRQSLLRREDAIQRNTLSTENAFASCGVQHTGEFHDCLPLPVLESTEMTKSNVLLSEKKDNDERMEEELIDQNKLEKCTKEDNTVVESSTDLTLESNERNNDDNIENIDRTSASLEKDLNNLFGGLHPKDLAKLLVNQVNRRPIMLGLVDIVSNSVIGTNPNVIFETNANLNVNEDVTRSVKDDSTLQNSYLNFITSVEDNETNHVITGTSKEYKDHSNEHSMQSLREPLALPGTPEGVLIEELSSLDSTTMSKLQDVSLNPINLESTTIDRESIEKSIDSENSMELLDKSDDVDVETPITAKRDENITPDAIPITKENVKTEESTSTKEDEIENKEETVKDNADQLLVNENIRDTNGETIEQSTSSSGIEVVENNENKKEYSDDKEENNEASSNEKDENKETNLSDQDENKEASSDDQGENKEASSDEKDKNKETIIDDKDENNEASSDEKTNNLNNSNNEESKLSNETMIQLSLNDSVEKSDDKRT